MTQSITSFPITASQITDLPSLAIMGTDLLPAQRLDGSSVLKMSVDDLLARVPVPPDPPVLTYPYVFAGFTGDSAASFAASQKIGRHVASDAVTLPAGLSGSYFVALHAAALSTVITLSKNGTAVGTATFAASGTSATVTFSSPVSLAPGDTLGINAPSTPDATLAGVAWSIRATR